MDEKTLLAVAEMFKVANKSMSEMVKTLKDMNRSLVHAGNSWPNKRQDMSYLKSKKRLKSAELSRDEYRILKGEITKQDDENI